MNGRFLVLLHAVALAAVVAAAGGSVGLMLWVGRHNPSSVLLVLFALWVVSPFMGLQLVDMFSKRWSVRTQATLHSVTLALALGSLAIYWYVALRPPTPTPAFVFLVVPLASWLLMAAAVPAAARISGTSARRGSAGTMVLEPSVDVVESELQSAADRDQRGPLWSASPISLRAIRAGQIRNARCWTKVPGVLECLAHRPPLGGRRAPGGKDMACPSCAARKRWRGNARARWPS